MSGAAGPRHLPLALFAAPMGLGALGHAWREAHVTRAAPAVMGEALLLLACLAWLALACLHGARALRHPDALVADLHHPVGACFAAAASIGMFLVAGFLAPHAPALAAPVWGMAALAQLAIAVWVVRGAIGAARELSAITPAMLLLLVSNILAPLSGVRLGLPELSWMMFGIGALLWAALHPLILLRLLAGPALPPLLWPTLCIPLAPPAMGSLSLAALTGGFGAGPLAVLRFGAFVALVLLTLLPSFSR